MCHFFVCFYLCFIIQHINSDGGKSWAEYDWGLSAIPVSVSFISSSVGWMSGGESPLIPLLNLTTWRSTLSKTTDGGASWTTLEDTFDSGLNFKSQIIPHNILDVTMPLLILLMLKLAGRSLLKIAVSAMSFLFSFFRIYHL